jgi:hypothetical protein
LGEDEVAGSDDAASLIALSKECEEHFHFLAVLLDVANSVDDDGIDAIEPPQHRFQVQVSLGRQEARYQLVRKREVHPEASLDELVTHGRHQMGLAPAGQVLWL